MFSSGRSRRRRMLLAVTIGILFQSYVGQLQSGLAQDNKLVERSEGKRFAVISIHPSKGNAPMAFGPDPNGYTAKNTPLSYVIMEAYYPKPEAFWRDDRLHAPKWVNDTTFDIEARFDDATTDYFSHLGDTEREKQIQPFLRSLLAQRCALEVSITQRDAPFLALLVGPHGPKLEATTPNADRQAGIAIADGGFMRPFFIPGTDQHAFRFTNATMDAFTEALSGLTDNLQGLPLENKTGLGGRYSFTLMKNEPDSTLSTTTSDHEPPPATRWDLGGLGLTLKKMNGPLPSIDVVHIDKPDAN